MDQFIKHFIRESDGSWMAVRPGLWPGPPVIVVTPPDVLSQFMLAVPMCILYEAGLFFARFVGVRPKPESEYKTQP